MKKNITLKDVKANKQINEFIKKGTKVLELYHYTDHGLEHSELVSKRALFLAKQMGFSKRDQELAAISGFTHDMGNFLGRENHEHWGALLFQSVFQNEMPVNDLVTVMQAIANHDNYYAKVVNPIAAIVILADKSDVRRTRVTERDEKIIKEDIHNRVNYAATDNKFEIDTSNKRITLILKIDTNFVPVIEYFEIFTRRMVQCRRAAQYLGYNFALVINNFKLL